jgi:ABC-type sugar transport systems, permease components
MKRLSNARLRDSIDGYLFIAPTFIIYIVFMIIPMISSFSLSFFSYDFFSKPRFIGLDNYVNIFKAPRIGVVYLNTFIFAISSVTLNVFLGVLLAVMLNRKLPSIVNYILRLAYFFPVIVSLVYGAVVWGYLFAKDTGVINYYLGLVGIEPVGWLTDGKMAMVAIVLIDVWKNVGFSMVLLLAGLQNIPKMYYESARIDGAKPGSLFRHITLPLLSPTIFFVFIITIIGALQVFDSINILTMGGPGDSTRSVVMYIYEEAFQGFRMGYASAVSITLFIIILLLTLFQFRLSKKWVSY